MSESVYLIREQGSGEPRGSSSWLIEQYVRPLIELRPLDGFAQFGIDDQVHDAIRSNDKT